DYSDIGSPEVNGPLSPDYVPGLDEPEKAPLSPDYVPGLEEPEQEVTKSLPQIPSPPLPIPSPPPDSPTHIEISESC
nr:hypothetical protein [Tanacetum cinerariifolium]